MNVLETDRLTIRFLTLEDAAFILELVNEPSWLEFIGDKGVRTIDDARDYLLKGPMDMYARLGFGLLMTELKDGAIPLGLCGLIKRDTLEDVDLGFAFLPRYWGKGYAREAAQAVIDHGKSAFGLKRVVAITKIANHRSINLLERIGFVLERRIKLTPDEPDINLLAHES